MQRLKYRITTLSPVLIAVDAGEVNTVHTSNVITGSTLLGAFAHRYITSQLSGKRNNACQNPTFHTWFLTDSLKFTNAYIVNTETNNVHFPSPFSLQQEKNEKPIKERKGKRLIDLLFEEDALEETQTKPLEEFVFLKDGLVDTYSVKKSLNFHHQRDKTTGTTKEGMIFNYESIAPGQVFEGNIVGAEAELQRFLTVFGQADPVYYLGRSKSAQYGKVKIEFRSTAPEEFFSEIDHLNKQDRTLAGKEIPLTLLSDLILYDQHGFSTATVEALEIYLRETIPSLTIKKSFIKIGDVETFISVWGLRKPAGVCFQAGSSFLIGIAQADNNKLFRLQCEGIGERCNEGFGRIVFGWQQDDVSPKATTTPKPQPPECPMPGLTKEIVETALKELFMKQVKLDALQKAQEFIKLPTRALLGRLEAMVATLEKDQFVEVLEKKLRKTAREKLDQCRGKSETFLDFLKTYEVNLEDMLKKKEYASFQKLAEVIHFSPNHDATFVKETNRLYLTTLLAFMRKSVKRQKGGA